MPESAESEADEQAQCCDEQRANFGFGVVAAQLSWSKPGQRE
jgi:hypothetical protein